MAVRIRFDNNHKAITPTLVLATRSGLKLGALPATGISVSDNFNTSFDLSFSVYKFDNGVAYPYWDSITDFKLVWCKEWDVWFEIYIQVQESNDTVKSIQAKSLGEAELSQIILHDIEINTNDDIDNDDYTVTVLWNPEQPKGSLLHRIMEKAPHYTVTHVDTSIANIQRSFSFDNTSLYDAFNEISEEIDCLFVYDSSSANDGSIRREIRVYDLEDYCPICGKRFEHSSGSSCPDCGNTNIIHGYGEDTNIYVSVENLANDISYDTDTSSVKNCFRLEAGDDLMTATIRNSNPNGSGYIWYIPEETRRDMSDELSARLAAYDDQYDYYLNEYEAAFSGDIVSQYNALVDKYSVYREDLEHITVPVVGYQALMNAYYGTIDFYLFLHDSFMPTPEIQHTTAATEAAKLTVANLSPTAVQSLNSVSSSSASNAVLTTAKSIVNPNFQVKIKSSSYNSDTHIWTGSFTVTSYSDDEDTASSANINVLINDEYETFVKQKIAKALNTNVYVTDAVSVSDLFKLSLEDYRNEMKKYNLVSLQTFADAARACVDILIEQGIADNQTWANKNPNMYEELYIPYYDKLVATQNELKLRENELYIIGGHYDANGGLISEGMQNQIVNERKAIQTALDFESFVGEELWLEFSAYRREDTYSNNNFISDGLDNAGLFNKAAEFLNVARNEIFKSATLQHSISASLANLLVMEEFEPIVDYFSVGNWIHICVDDKVYRLRLLSYTINFDDLSALSITFSDVKEYRDGITDTQSVIAQAASMASSYDHVSRQASQGEKGNKQLDDWVENGLSLTNMKIVSGSDNQDVMWDSHGILLREYVPELDDYSDKQVKIINRGLYVTNDGWETAKAGIGDFEFFNPATNQIEEAYGVIADTLVGNLILGETVGVYNTTGSIVMNQDGFTITSDNRYEGENDVHFTIQKRTFDENGDEVLQQVAYFDSDGEFVLSGNVLIYDEQSPDVNSVADLCDTTRYQEMMETRLTQEKAVTDATITEKARAVADEAAYNLNSYKAELGQYVRTGSDGLTLGAVNSNAKTVIDNQGVWFYNDGFKVAYINHNQLHIPNAVIDNSMQLGKFVFIPRENGSVALVWQGE